MLVQVAPRIPAGHQARCARCAHIVPMGPRRDPAPTLLLALGAAALFVPAQIFPVLRTRIYGSISTHTVIGSAGDLADAGSYITALLVLFGGVIAPAFEILGLLYLTAVPPSVERNRPRGLIQRTLAVSMPWNMLVVFIVAFMVSAGILRLIFTVRIEPGLYFYTAMATLLIAARFTFDHRQVWTQPEVRP